MTTFLGLLGVVVFIVGVVVLAAAVTFLTVKLTPARKAKEPQQAEPDGA